MGTYQRGECFFIVVDQPCEFSWFCVAKCELCEQMKTRVSMAVKQPLNTFIVACARKSRSELFYR
jgi:hypothetical protein